MRKSILYIAVMAGILASCSNDEMLDKAPAQANGMIGFSTSVDKNSRGVTDLTAANLANFKVWGYESSTDNASDVVTRFNDVTVNKTDGGWTYTPPQYWTAGNYYWFSGYSATNANAAAFVTAGTTVWPASAVNPSTNQLFGGTIYFNNGIANWESPAGNLAGAVGDSDLLYAWWKTDGAVVKGEEPTVDFTFKHILSKVAFKFVNNMPYSTIKVTKLVVKSVAPQGTLDMTVDNPAWTVSGTGFDMDYAQDISALSAIAPSQNATSNFNIFIPAAFTYNIQFTVEVSQNGVVIATYNHNVNVSNLTLEMGRAYVLTAALDKTNIDPAGALVPITFNPTVDDWDNTGAADVNVPAAE